MNQLHKAAGQGGAVALFQGHVGRPSPDVGSTECGRIVNCFSSKSRVFLSSKVRRQVQTSQRTITGWVIRPRHNPCHQRRLTTVCNNCGWRLDNSNSIKTLHRKRRTDGGKTKTAFVVPPTARLSFHCDDGNKGIILRLFHPTDVQYYMSVCWTASERSWNHCLGKSSSRNTTLEYENTQFTLYLLQTNKVVASVPKSMFLRRDLTCWEGINIFVWLHYSYKNNHSLRLNITQKRSLVHH